MTRGLQYEATALGTLQILTHLKMITTFSHYCLPFADEEMEAQRGLRDLPRATGLLSGGVSAPCSLTLSTCC